MTRLPPLARREKTSIGSAEGAAGIVVNDFIYLGMLAIFIVGGYYTYKHFAR